MQEDGETGESRRDLADRLDDLRIAAAFLTRLPMGGGGAAAPGALAEAAWAFPIVGLGVGLVGGLVYLVAAGIGLAGWPAAVLAVAAQLLLTGALHEDGLADVADGFGGGATRDRKLEIMRDSRIGAFGVSALILALMARIAVVAELADPSPVIAVLLAAGAASRAAVVAAMNWLDPAQPDGLGADAGRPEPARVMIAGGVALLAALVALGVGAGVIALIVAAAGAAMIGALAQQQIGGHTGDVLGAVQQAAEIAFLLAAVAALGGG